MALDIKRLVAEIHAVNHERKHRVLLAALYKTSPAADTRSTDWGAYWKAHRDYEARFGTDRATKLYSLRAHARGRLHMTKEWWTCDEAGHSVHVCRNQVYDGVTALAHAPQWHLVQRTMEDQAKLVEDIAKEFELPEEVAATAVA